MKKTLLIFVCILIIFGCKKDKTITKDKTPPEVETLSVTASSPVKILLRGKITNTDNQAISEYGFLYSSASTVDEGISKKISLGNSLQQGEFTTEITDLILPIGASRLHAKAYIIYKDEKKYGKVVSTNVPAPETATISPMMGKSGDLITITGRFASVQVKDITVKFLGVNADVKSVQDTKIEVLVPSGVPVAHNFKVSIAVFIGGQSVEATNAFTMLAHVKDFIPKSGPVATRIILAGDNLPNDNSLIGNKNFKVDFGTVPPMIINNKELEYLVSDQVSKTFQIFYWLNNQKQSVPGEFTVTAPVITSLDKYEVLVGTSGVVNGTNFPTGVTYSQGLPEVYLDDLPVSVTEFTPGRFFFNIERDFKPGEYTFNLKSGPNTVQADRKVKIVEYEASDFNPKKGTARQVINITGRFIRGYAYSIRFGSMYISDGMATSDTNLQFTYPGGLQPGKIKIMFEVFTKPYPVPGEFEVL